MKDIQFINRVYCEYAKINGHENYQNKFEKYTIPPTGMGATFCGLAVLSASSGGFSSKNFLQVFRASM